MLPDHVLRGSVDPDANFTIPAVRSLRLEAITQLRDLLSSGGVYMPSNEKLRTTIAARLAALQAFEAVAHKPETKKKA